MTDLIECCDYLIGLCAENVSTTCLTTCPFSHICEQFPVYYTLGDALKDVIVNAEID